MFSSFPFGLGTSPRRVAVLHGRRPTGGQEEHSLRQDRESQSRGSSGLVLAVLLTLPALFVSASPRVGLLQFDRAALAAGELWRLVTGHWTHWTEEHLLLDALVFFGLTWACARRSARTTLATLAGAALVIPAALWVALPQMATYRGLSGLDAALFALLAGWQLREARATRNPRQGLLAGTALVLLAAKTLYEVATADALFVDQASGGFVPVPLAHAVGGGFGLAAAWIGRRAGPLRAPADSR